MRILTLTLPFSLHPGEIPAFRGSIAELVGLEHEVFHNHDNAHKNYRHHHWDYPLIQYAVRRGKATLIGIGEGADAIQQLMLPKLSGQLQFAKRTHEITGFHMHAHEHNWQLLDAPQQYGLYGWLALNQSNYKDWKKSSLAEARHHVLERALTGHLRVLANTVGVKDLPKVIGNILEVNNQKRVHCLGTQFVRFHVLMESTLALPHSIGLGRSAAFGFGEVLPVKIYQQFTRQQSKSLETGL